MDDKVRDGSSALIDGGSLALSASGNGSEMRDKRRGTLSYPHRTTSN